MHQHLPLHLRPHTRSATQENGGSARSQSQRGTPRVSRLFINERGLRKPIARLTHPKAEKKLQWVFIDLCWKMTVPSIGGKWYTLIVWDDCTHLTRVYSLGKKSDAASASKTFLAEVRADGTPSAVMAVRSDNRGECLGRISRKYAASVVSSKCSRHQTAPSTTV